MWFLGIDIGTTHVKAVGVTSSGQILPAARCRTPVRTHQGLPVHMAEEVWEQAVGLITRYASGPAAPHGRLGGLSVATFGQEESVAVDAAGREIHPSLAWWEDGDTEALGPGVAEWFDSPEHYAVSGMRYRPNQTPGRIARLRTLDPATWRSVSRWVDFGSYAMWRLTGRWAAAASQITHSQLFDLADLTPHQPSLDALEVGAELFPEALLTGHPVGEIRADVLGVPLAPGAGVYVGGHDQMVAARAVALDTATGSSAAPQVFDSIGTSEYLMVVSPARRPGRLAYERGLDHERAWGTDDYLLWRAIPSGKVIQLLAELFFDGDFDRLFACLPEPRRAVPSLRAVISPLTDTGQGLLSLDGIPAGATPADIVHCCLDTVARQVTAGLTEMCAFVGTRPSSVALLGSLFRRPELVQHRQDRSEVPLLVSTLDEPVATGAAQLAREGSLATKEQR